jgi:hypothetical protein
VIQRWSTHERRLLRRRAPHATALEIAAELGRTVHAVRQRAHLDGVPLQKAGDRDYRTKYSDQVVERARALHEAGAPPKRIARELAVPIGSIKSFVYYRARLPASITLLHVRTPDDAARQATEC